MNWFENLAPVVQALIAATFTWGITALGALIVCFFKKVNKKILNINELAIKIEELLYDEIKRSFFSRYSRMRYEKYYQLNIMGTEMEKIIYGK